MFIASKNLKVLPNPIIGLNFKGKYRNQQKKIAKTIYSKGKNSWQFNQRQYIINQQNKDSASINQISDEDYKQWRLHDQDPLKNKLNEIGLGIREVEQDGNSLFRVISDQLLGTSAHHQELRTEICECMLEQREYFSNKIKTESVQVYVDRMRTNGKEGGPLELLAAALVRKVNVCVCSYDLQNQLKIRYVTKFPGEIFIYVCRHSRYNFNSVRLIEDTQKKIINHQEIYQRLKGVQSHSYRTKNNSYRTNNTSFQKPRSSQNQFATQNLQSRRLNNINNRETLEPQNIQNYRFQNVEGSMQNKRRKNEIDIISNFKYFQDAQDEARKEKQDEHSTQSKKIYSQDESSAQNIYRNSNTVQKQEQQKTNGYLSKEKSSVQNEDGKRYQLEVLGDMTSPKLKDLSHRYGAVQEEKQNKNSIYSIEDEEGSRRQKSGSENQGTNFTQNIYNSQSFNIQRKTRYQKHKQQNYNSGRGFRRQKNRREKTSERCKPQQSNLKTPFEIELQRLGLRIEEMPGDGNCLFRAIGDQIQGKFANHKKTRSQIMNYVEKNKEQFRDFATNCSIEEYIQNKRRDGVWGDEIELQAASQLFKVNICILQPDSPPRLFDTFPDGGSNTIFLSYHGNVHYNSIRKFGDYGRGPPQKLPVKAISKTENHYELVKQETSKSPQLNSHEQDLERIRQQIKQKRCIEEIQQKSKDRSEEENPELAQNQSTCYRNSTSQNNVQFQEQKSIIQQYDYEQSQQQQRKIQQQQQNEIAMRVSAYLWNLCYCLCLQNMQSKNIQIYIDTFVKFLQQQYFCQKYKNNQISSPRKNKAKNFQIKKKNYSTDRRYSNSQKKYRQQYLATQNNQNSLSQQSQNKQRQTLQKNATKKSKKKRFDFIRTNQKVCRPQYKGTQRNQKKQYSEKSHQHQSQLQKEQLNIQEYGELTEMYEESGIHT